MGNIIINNTVEGAILDIEVFGNTYQNPDSLEDLQSVGTLRENGLYEISILSTNGKEIDDPLYQLSKSLVIMPCQLEKFEDLQDKLYYDKAKKLWCINKVAKVVYEEGVLVNKQVSPETIELPLDVYVQLNSFFGDTHIIVEGTEIKPTVKAKISKSLAASVSSVNSKSDILSDRIDNIIVENSNFAIKTYVDQQDTSILQGAKEYTDNEIAKINNLNFQVVVELPEVGEDNIIYLLPNESSDDNLYIEYIWLNGKWEIWGSASIDLTPYATKEELTSQLETKSDIGHNHDDRYYTEAEIDEKLAGITSNTSAKVNVTDTQWNLVDGVYVTNITHPLNTTDVLVEAYDSDNNESVMIGKRPIDINTIEIKSDFSANLTIYVVNAGLPIEGLEFITAKGTSFDNSTNGMISTTVQDAIEENNTNIKAIESEFDKPVNTQYSTVNGVKEFECKDGYIDNVVIEGKTLVNLGEKSVNNFTLTVNTSKNIVSYNFKPNTEYTLILEFYDNATTSNNPTDLYFVQTELYGNCNLSGVEAKGIVARKIITSSNPPTFWNIGTRGTFVGSVSVKNFMILEGDYTQNHPSYFEGLKSVGQGDKIEVLSSQSDNNLLPSLTFTDKNYVNSETGIITSIETFKYSNEYIPVQPNTDYLLYNINLQVAIYDSNKTIIPTKWQNNRTFEIIGKSDYQSIFLLKTPSNARYIRINIPNTNIQPYSLHLCKYDKKQINTTLRSLPNGVKDEIIKQGNKYYKIKRCGEYTIQSSDIVSFSTGLTNCATLICKRFPNQKFFADGLMNNFMVCDLFKQKPHVQYNVDIEGIHEQTGGDKYIYIDLLKTRLHSLDISGGGRYLSEHLVTVVYELITPVLEELPNFNPRCFGDKTTLLLNSGVVQADASFEVSNSIRSELEVLKAKTSDLDDYVVDEEVYYPTLLNGWVEVDTSDTFKLNRSKNICTLTFRIRSGITSFGTVIFNIPNKYRPSKRIRVSLTNSVCASNGFLIIYPNGNCSIHGVTDASDVNCIVSYNLEG